MNADPCESWYSRGGKGTFYCIKQRTLSVPRVFPCERCLPQTRYSCPRTFQPSGSLPVSSVNCLSPQSSVTSFVFWPLKNIHFSACWYFREGSAQHSLPPMRVHCAVCTTLMSWYTGICATTTTLGGMFPSLPWDFQHYYRIIVGDAGLEPGTFAPEVWCAANEPPEKL